MKNKWLTSDMHSVHVFTRQTPSEQWITNVIVPFPKKGDLNLMTNYTRITLIILMSIAAKIYNKVFLIRIRDHVDLLKEKIKLDFVLAEANSHPVNYHGSLWQLPTSTHRHFHRL